MTLVGHDAAWREWREAMASERMHHAWLLTGQRGLGKASFAQAAARALVAEDGVPQPAGDHPDILTLTHLPKDDENARKRDEGKPYETKRNIAIDQIRQLHRRLTTRPTLGRRRAIIIDPADDMEAAAANALLKSLEEPPQGSFFLLVAHRPGRLLPTIRSRCRVLAFPRLSEAQLLAVLADAAPETDPAMRMAAIAAAGGSPGAALDFVTLDLAPMHALMERIAQKGDPDFSLRGALAAAMGARPPRARQLAAIELVRAVADARRLQVSPQGIPALVETHAALVRLGVEAPTYNFDAGLLVMEIGTLLTHLAPLRDAAHG